MSDNNRTYRIRTEVGKDNVLNVNLNQDYKTFEVLSLKIDSDNLYKFHTADYGCVAGRVLANGNFGIPNAKISIFIKATEEDQSDAIMSYLYPYRNTRTKNDDGIRYNLLPDEQLSDCHRNVGTFPSKRLILDDNNVFEVYDKYYKYTTRSNEAGDYMIFGVPVGDQTIHVDIDLSDIGILSQRPRDMIYKGHSVTQFENANMFKKSTDLDTLTQIISQNANVYVYPFWGEKSEGDVAITRKDIEIQYTFETTCVFMGSIFTDEKSNAISKTCIPSERMGKMDRLTTGSGTIEMIRKKADGDIEEVIVQGNQLIDGNGTWCYQIPLNLDYVCTDEYGNIVPTDDPKKGVATRARVRFRIAFSEFESGTEFSHAAKTLVPNNPQNKDEVDYVFGSKTKDTSFKDIFWNQVYSVKSYIPRFQQGNYNRNKRFSGIKEVNVNGGNNPLPYNNLRVDINFAFALQCAIFHILLKIVTFYNKIMNWLTKLNVHCSCGIFSTSIGLRSQVEKNASCLFLGDGYCPDLQGWYFAPGCVNSAIYSNTFSHIREGEDKASDSKSVEAENSDDDKVCLTRSIEYFIQCTELNMAMEYNVIQFDFYNDWINGAIYSPRWNADIRKKRSYLFGLIRINPRLNACSEENFTNTRRLVQQCAMSYNYDNNASAFTKNASEVGCVKGNNKKQKCHKAKGREYTRIFGGNGGVVHRESTSQSQNIYYYKPCEWRDGKKRLFFATDIILLGSLNEIDGQGIPQTFKKIPSSTYQMPDALASTNIGAEGFLYGVEGGGQKCTNANKDLGYQGVTVFENESSFEGLVNWSRGSEEFESNPYDDPKPITETSGIDWGFHGPEQGGNNLSSLYFPGGHFLGISCFAAEVNIKSCINLSRLCELGTTISHRQSFVVKGLGDTYKFIYSVPNGLVAKDEILDYTGKNEFATLNYNSLKTKRNKETGLLEYDFATIFPLSFNGELKENLGGEYNNPLSDNTFKRVVEENSRDYYKFRLGINNENDNERAMRKKYLIDRGSAVSMPVYENSFYFYFGLKDGNTAMERFNHDFFAVCPESKEYKPEVEIEITNADACDVAVECTNERCRSVVSLASLNVTGEIHSSDGLIDNVVARCPVCGNNVFRRIGSYGSLRITVDNVDDSRYACYTDEEQANFISFEGSTAITGLLTSKEYNLIVVGENLNTINKNIKIEIEKPTEFSEPDFTHTDFSAELYFTKERFEYISDTDVENLGYISFGEDFRNNNKVAAVLITNGVYYVFAKGNLSYFGLPITGITPINYSGNCSNDLERCYVWEGNATYEIYVKIECGENSYYSNWFKYGEAYIMMPVDFDVIFAGNEQSTYKKFVKFTYSFLVGGPFYANEFSEDVINSYKLATFFRKSNCILEGDDIRMEMVNLRRDWHYTIYAETENITENLEKQKPQLNTVRTRTATFESLKPIYQPHLFAPTKDTGYTFATEWAVYNNNSFDNNVGQWDIRLKKSYDLVNPYYTAYINNTDKNYYWYDLDVRDSGNTKVDEGFSFRSYYMPFYFKTLFVTEDYFINDEHQIRRNISLGIANGIKKNGKYNSVKINGVEVSNATEDTWKWKYENFDYNTIYNKYGDYYDDGFKNSFSLEDIFPIDILDNNGPGTEWRYNSNGEYNVSVTDYGDTINKTVVTRFIGDRDEYGNLYPFMPEADTHVRYYSLNPNAAEKIFKAYYYCSKYDKYLISNKDKRLESYTGNTWMGVKESMFSDEIKGFERERLLKNKFFYDWQLGKSWEYYTTGGTYSESLKRDIYSDDTRGVDYNTYAIWPVYADKDYSNYGWCMWSSWAICDPITGDLISNDRLPDGRYMRPYGGYWYYDSELYGTLQYNTGYVIGVYDADYHKKTGERLSNFHLEPDPHSSKITIIRIYTTESFNDYRRQLEMIP